MSLVTKLRATKKFSHEDVRRYALMLESDDPGKLNELMDLSGAMDKTLSDVETDAAAIRKARELAQQIAAGRDTNRALQDITLQITQHEGDTRKIVKQRQQEVQPLHSQRGDLIAARDEAVKAIGSLNELKDQHGPLLEAFTVPSESELH